MQLNSRGADTDPPPQKNNTNRFLSLVYHHVNTDVLFYCTP